MLKYKGYIAKTEFDDEAEIFYGTVINTRDKITFQADCAKDLKTEFHTSVDEYLAFCEELGEEPEKPYSGRFVLRLSPEVHREAAAAAQLANQSLNAWLATNIERSAKQALQ